MLSERELKVLPRRVGRMGYEEAERLFYETRAKRDAHRDAACQHCEYITYTKYPNCPEYDALWKQACALPIFDSSREAAYHAAHEHRDTCSTCVAGQRQVREWERCAYDSQLFAIQLIYQHRMDSLEHKEHLKQFEQEHGRPPKDKLEFLEWVNRLQEPEKQPPQPEQALAVVSALPNVDILTGQIRESSRAMYRRDIAAYVAWAEAEGLAALEAATFARWRTALAGKSDYSPHTINRMLAAVKRLMAEAAEQGYISHELAGQFSDRRGVKVRALKERLKDHARTYIAPVDMRRLAALPDAATLKGKRDAALLHTLASSGIRVSEAAGLTTDAIQATPSGYLLQVTGKTDETPRQAPLSAEAHQAIVRWLAARPISSPYIFTAKDGRGQRWSTRPLTSQAIEQLVTAYAEVAGLQHVKPHDFRRFVGTQLARQDIRKAQLALGHKSIETTARHYDLGKLEPGMTDGLY